MILKRRVALNGVQLDALDERIIISGIDEAAGRDNITATSSANANGQRIVQTRRDTLDVTIRFLLNIKNNNMQARSELLEAINAWAAPGGWLTLGHRPGRRLGVVLAQAPGAGDMFSWANEYTLAFRAYAVPYWEDSTAVSATSVITNGGSLALTVPGNAKTVANATIENVSGMAINWVNLTIGGSAMSFSGGQVLPAGGALYIEHPQDTARIWFRARNNRGSVMLYRSGANDYNVSPGTISVSFSAERAVRVNVSVKGRYL